MSTQNQQVTPDQLLESFRGRSLKSVILFTVIAHVVIVGGTSIPYFMKSISGKNAANLSEQDRTELAAKEATTALRDIAKKHNIKPQDLSTRISGGAAPKAAKEEETTPDTPATEDPKNPENPNSNNPENKQPETTGENDKPKSEYVEKLEVKEEGPKVPPIPVEEATEEDLFK